jgi:hypothetical protein
MKQNTLIVILAIGMAITTGSWLLYDIEFIRATSTGRSTDVGETVVKAPPAITGDNTYVAWWTNETGNDEVMFRASVDAGQTFGDKINLSNTTNADSTRVEIDSDADNVVVSWWETNQTSDTPVMRVSNNNGETFGPLLELATNGSIGEAAEPDE